MSWFSQQWNRFAGAPEDDDSPTGRIEVVWGRERMSFNVDFRMTLRRLKEAISEQTSIPYEQIKLITGGLILKDDKAPLSAFNIRSGTRLTLLGTSGGVPIRGDMPGMKSSVLDADAACSSSNRQQQGLSKGEEMAQRKREKEADVSEAGLMRRIEEALSDVRKDVVPEVLEFEKLKEGANGGAGEAALGTGATAGAAAAASAAQHPPQQQSREALAKQQRKLSELLLRALLTLDGIHVTTEETRRRRKEAVKEVQSYLDRVDSAWQQIKAQGSGGGAGPGSGATQTLA